MENLKNSFVYLNGLESLARKRTKLLSVYDCVPYINRADRSVDNNYGKAVIRSWRYKFKKIVIIKIVSLACIFN